MAGCTIAGCPNPHEARGWCSHHYGLWHRYGTTEPHTRIRPIDGPLVCQCPHPRPDLIDECQHCRRVVAEAVHNRRNGR